VTIRAENLHISQSLHPFRIPSLPKTQTPSLFDVAKAHSLFARAGRTPSSPRHQSDRCSPRQPRRRGHARARAMSCPSRSPHRPRKKPWRTPGPGREAVGGRLVVGERTLCTFCQRAGRLESQFGGHTRCTAWALPSQSPSRRQRRNRAFEALAPTHPPVRRTLKLVVVS
jgi:hypothetical protein